MFDAVFDAVIVAGGGARRLSGTDKPAVMIGSASMLDHVLAAVAAAGRTVIVGPQRPVQRVVTWCIEEPPGSGPVAALAAGLPHATADVIVVLAADLPWVAPAVPRLIAALADDPSADCATLVAGGRSNYLAAAWRRRALTAGLAALPDVRDQSMRRLYRDLAVVEVNDEGDAGRDCDTWDDIDIARRRAELSRETP